MMRKACRRQTRVCLVLALLALLLNLVPGNAPVRAQTLSPEFAPGQVLIGWQVGEGPVPVVPRKVDMLAPDQNDPIRQTAVREISRLTGLTVLRAAPEYGIARLAVKAGAEAAEIARLQALPWVRYAEPNYYVYAAGETLIPNDPDYPKQWNMDRVAAPVAWAVARGSFSFIVAVLDTGVAQSHPEFAGKLLPGKDYVNSPDTDGPEDDDPTSHGTHVTGIIAAGFDNGQGVAGLAPDVKVLPLKVLNNNRTGFIDDIAEAIQYAADYGAQVINLSLTTSASSTTLQTAVNYALGKGRLIVAAAGNLAQPQYGNPILYPAAYPDVLAVAASDYFDGAASYSEHHSYVDLAAPGGMGTSAAAIYSTTRSSYGYQSGTSMSTPMVSAAAALVWILKPAATHQEVADILKNTADKVGTDPSGQPLSYETGRNDYFGFGRLNVGWAVRAVYPPSLTTNAGPQSFLLGEPLTTQSRMIEITNPSNRGVSWQATVLGADWLSVTPGFGTSLYSVPGYLTLTAELGELTPATYSGLVRVQPLDPADLPGFEILVQLRVVESVSLLYLPFARAAP